MKLPMSLRVLSSSKQPLRMESCIILPKWPPGSDETTKSIADVSTVNQHISEQSGTVQEAAAELADLADQLHLLVDRFKI